MTGQFPEISASKSVQPTTKTKVVKPNCVRLCHLSLQSAPGASLSYALSLRPEMGGARPVEQVDYTKV